MDPWTLFLVLYGLSIALANVLTYSEYRQRRAGRRAYPLLGHLLCTLWPLVALVLVVAYRPGAKARSALRPE